MTGLIARFGVLGVFLLMVPESACIPVPSEVTLLFSGFAVSQHWMSFALAVLAATAGNVVGSLIAYAIGAARIPTRLPGSRMALAYGAEALGEHELRTVFIARLLPLARTFVSLPAGARRVPVVAFTLLTTAGCAIWASALILLGVISARAWAAVNATTGKLLIAIGVVPLVLYGVRRLHPGSIPGQSSGSGVTLSAIRARRAEVSESQSEEEHPGRRSSSADAAAARWADSHPEDDPEHPPPSDVPEDEEVVPNRHSASAEAASLRWQEQHDEDDQMGGQPPP